MGQEIDILITHANTLKIQGRLEEAAINYEKAAELCQYLGEKQRKHIYLTEAKKLRAGLDKRLQNLKRQDIIRSTILELGTKFPRLAVVEIAEKCAVDDEDLVVKIVQDMITNKQIAAEYFESTQTVAFNQQVNIQERDKFIAELEKAFAMWGKEDKKA